MGQIGLNGISSIPSALRSAGSALRCRRKIGNFGPRFHALMREKGIKIKPQMLVALHTMPAPGMGRLLAEALIKNQLEPSSCIEIIETVGKMMLRLGSRKQPEVAKFFMVAVSAIKGADTDSLVRYMNMAEEVGQVREEKFFCESWIKTEKMDIDQAVAFIAEMDIIRAYEEKELASLVLMGSMLFSADFIGRFAAIKFYSVKKTAALARVVLKNLGFPFSKKVTDILMRRGITSSKQVAIFFDHYLSSSRRDLCKTADYLVVFCQRNKYNNQKIARLIMELIKLEEYTLNQMALLTSKVASLVNSCPRGVYDLARIGAFVKTLADVLGYDKAQKLALAEKVAQCRGLKAERANQLIEIVTS